MIKNIFIPNIIGSYYIFSQRIVGFDIGKTYVQATVVKAYRNKRTIEKFLQEKILEESELSYQERVSKAIGKILNQVGQYNLVYTSMPSGLAIYKEISVPFVQLEKIKMILPYEVGPMLPFSADTAVIDCLVTNIDKEKNQSDLITVAVKQEALAQHLQLFESIGVHPKKVSIDLFELYSLYCVIPAYKNYLGVIALVDIGYYATRLAIIVNGQLRYIRSLSSGLLSLAKDNHENTLVFEKDKMQQFMNNIQFSMQPYKEKLEDTDLSKIIFTGHGAEIQGLVEVLESICNNNCEIFHPNKLLQKDNTVIDFTQNNITNIPQSFVVSLATALSLPITQDFNLYYTQSTAQDEKLFNWQIIIAISLLGLIIGGLIFDTWLMQRKFNSEIEFSSQEVLGKLKSNFEKLKQSKIGSNLKKANDLAEEEVRKEDAIISQVLRRDRVSVLASLEELSRRINRQELGFKISKLIINDQQGQIVLDGKVRDYKELAKLEEDLRRSKMFTFLSPKLQDTTFEIKLGINNNYGKE